MKRILAMCCAVLLLTSLLCSCGSKPLEDGTYTIEVTLEGGSGRASVQSPATLVVAGDSKTAVLVWSSPYYTYMLVNGERYDKLEGTGNSTFEIPVILDEDLPVSAETTAMSEPHLIDYTLHFDSASAKGA